MVYRSLSKERRVYVREGAEEALRGAEKLIFDFDGVLVQTSQSYRQTVRKVVDYYFLELLGLEGEEGKLSTLRDIQKFKDTGLYNNDWSLSYAFITYYLTLIMRELEQKGALEEFTERFDNLQFSDIKTFVQSLTDVSDFLRSYKISAADLANLKDNGIITLDLFLVQAKLEKPKPIETSLVGVDPEVAEDEQRVIRKLVPYDLGKPDLLKRLFEEIYLGKDLFTKIYDEPSFFRFDESFLDKETFIPTKETLKLLSQRFGEFGIYSGRPRPQGMYILEKYGYIGYFDEQSSVFLGDLLKSEVEMERLGKPDPTLFIELVERMVDRETGVMYVGDGVADALMVEKAKAKGLKNLCFLGVMSSSEDSSKLFTEYTKHGVDAAVTDVNDIPYLLESLGGSV
ncbi:MAG TPA: HAD family hydrolase [Candidatus Bathyarchaeota archaeon]|nr:HAD family hydrolase [Candidatus Bathyarchaeota archaeon]